MDRINDFISSGIKFVETATKSDKSIKDLVIKTILGKGMNAPQGKLS